MAYVRQKANQLLIVHGDRRSETGKVEQRVLFTLYSKAEALEAIGKTSARRDGQFQQLLEGQYPDIRFDWVKINEQIYERMGNLPDLWDYGTNRLRKGFRRSVVDFVRHLLIADPQNLTSSRLLIQETRHELEYARELIDFRLRTMNNPPGEFDADTTFYWHYMSQGRYFPADEEECIEEMWHKGETEKAETLFRLMVECFDEYAEGHNYLGKIALEREDLEAAITHFSDAMEVGEKRFPKRLPKRDYWRDYRTRSYIRAVCNLIVTLNRLGEFDEAMDFTRVLEDRCGDRRTAVHYRAKILLNVGAYTDALSCAEEFHEGNSQESFIASLAAFELGRTEIAIAHFLYAALRYPQASRMIAGYKGRKPRTREEYGDHVLGLELVSNLV